MKHPRDIFKEAKIAATEAFQSACPVPMHIRGYAPISDGVCGFAWVKIKPARGPFVKYCKEQEIGYKSYTGGWDISMGMIDNGSQSMERKMAAGNAFAKVLVENGIIAHMYNRID